MNMSHPDIGNNALLLKGQSILRLWKPGALEFYGLDPENIDPWWYERARHYARINGDQLDWDIAENLIVTVGLNMTIDWMIDSEATGLTYHAIGTDGTTPAISDTTLTAEHDRKLFATRSRNAQKGELSAFYLSTEANVYIREQGVFGGAAASATANTGILFSHYLQPYDNSGGTPVDLTFDYEVEIGTP